MTVAKLFAAIETLSDGEREQAIRAAGARETAILARLDGRMHKRIVRELEALARGRPSA